MGQAKLRGTKEERVASAVSAANAKIDNFFNFLIEHYSKCAKVPVQLDNFADLKATAYQSLLDSDSLRQYAKSANYYSKDSVTEAFVTELRTRLYALKETVES
jgi:hypothetical protein